MIIRPVLDIGDIFENFGWSSVVSFLGEPPTTHHWFTNLKTKDFINQSEVSKPCLYPGGDSQNLNFIGSLVCVCVCL